MGNVQREVLSILIDRKEWSRKSGWNWNGATGTARIMDSLVKRGFVSREPRVVRGVMVDVYKPCLDRMSKKTRDRGLA